MMKIGLLERFIKGKTNSLSENIIVCVGTALTGTFYFYEYRCGEELRSVIGMTVSVLIAVIWMICAATSGRDEKIGFVIFSFLYWSVPYIYTLWYESRDNLMDYNKWLSMSNRAAVAVLTNPFSAAAEKFGTSPVILAAILLILVMLAYISGLLVKRRYDTNRTEMSDPDGEYEIDDDDENEVMNDLEEW